MSKSLMQYGWHHTDIQNISGNMAKWLQVHGNLTAKLAKLGQHELTVVSQNYGALPEEEITYLQQTTTHGLIRNITHRIDDHIIVLARTVISEQLYQQYKNDFDNLGCNAIGQTLLYQRNDVIRSQFEFGLVSAGIITNAFNNLLTLPEKIVARRSLFSIQNHSLMITELFLPEIQNHDLP